MGATVGGTNSPVPQTNDRVAPPRGTRGLISNSVDSFSMPSGDEGSVMLDLRQVRAQLVGEKEVDPEVGVIS